MYNLSFILTIYLRKNMYILRLDYTYCNVVEQFYLYLFRISFNLISFHLDDFVCFRIFFSSPF